MPAWIVEPVAPGPTMRMPDWDTRERFPMWAVEYERGWGGYALTVVEARDEAGAEQALLDELVGTHDWGQGRLRILAIEPSLPHRDHPCHQVTLAALAARAGSSR